MGEWVTPRRILKEVSLKARLISQGKSRPAEGTVRVKALMGWAWLAGGRNGESEGGSSRQKGQKGSEGRWGRASWATLALSMGEMRATGGCCAGEGCDLTFAEGHSGLWVETRLSGVARVEPK